MADETVSVFDSAVMVQSVTTLAQQLELYQKDPSTQFAKAVTSSTKEVTELKEQVKGLKDMLQQIDERTKHLIPGYDQTRTAEVARNAMERHNLLDLNPKNLNSEVLSFLLHILNMDFTGTSKARRERLHSAFTDIRQNQQNKMEVSDPGDEPVPSEEPPMEEASSPVADDFWGKPQT